MVYTFLCTIINGNVIAYFVQNKKVLRFCGPKKIFFAYGRNLETQPPPPLNTIIRIWLDPLPFPFVGTYFVDDH